MSQECLVSVIVPVYNSKRYVRTCLDSLLAQTLKEIEIIVVDDGSTDGSSDVLDEYAGSHSNIKVIHQSNQGQGAEMPACLSLKVSTSVLSTRMTMWIVVCMRGCIL